MHTEIIIIMIINCLSGCLLVTGQPQCFNYCYSNMKHLTPCRDSLQPAFPSCLYQSTSLLYHTILWFFFLCGLTNTWSHEKPNYWPKCPAVVSKLFYISVSISSARELIYLPMGGVLTKQSNADNAHQLQSTSLLSLASFYPWHRELRGH